ncbi:hypothetical protein HC725_16195 [Vibrio sp. S17_S38]|uniref:hypothetical protein n=1 Tax=Vibrio sp. S17_S38 TaxID=2720229 RepID=UPI00167FF101|nr:hypothetical protein [Vibrio sp. S17_S38]MBD1574791.1 hypothetical protein [Vibrio sp. S17_S38]
MTYTYNKRENIRTASSVEKLYSTNKGFIGYISNVEYKQSDGSWRSQGARWLINEDEITEIMDNGFKNTTL